MNAILANRLTGELRTVPVTQIDNLTPYGWIVICRESEDLCGSPIVKKRTRPRHAGAPRPQSPLSPRRAASKAQELTRRIARPTNAERDDAIDLIIEQLEAIDAMHPPTLMTIAHIVSHCFNELRARAAKKK